MMKVLMVCLGNICRSPLAEGILKHKTKKKKIYVDSAGTSSYHIGKLPDRRSIEIANKYGIDISDQRARQFSVVDFDRFDKIYAMDIHNINSIISIARNQSDRNKVDLILNEINPNSFDNIPDPYYGDGDGFQKVFNMLNEACDLIAKKL
ncbi:MAG: protein-tyrosine-phosphatase [Flavobacteriales bacterium]|nr:protein-tyrosine-phosphatase [Flavobacteriales bacterium]